MKRTYELKVGEQTITLKWGTWAMRLFCEKRNISVDQFFVELQNYFLSKEDSSAVSVPLQLIIDFISAGYEAQHKNKLSDEEICDLIDDLGGAIGGSGELFNYFNFVIAVTMNNVTPLPGNTDTPDEEKKSPELGMTS